MADVIAEALSGTLDEPLTAELRTRVAGLSAKFPLYPNLTTEALI